MYAQCIKQVYTYVCLRKYTKLHTSIPTHVFKKKYTDIYLYSYIEHFRKCIPPPRRLPPPARPLRRRLRQRQSFARPVQIGVHIELRIRVIYTHIDTYIYIPYAIYIHNAPYMHIHSYTHISYRPSTPSIRIGVHIELYIRVIYTYRYVYT